MTPAPFPGSKLEPSSPHSALGYGPLLGVVVPLTISPTPPTRICWTLPFIHTHYSPGMVSRTCALTLELSVQLCPGSGFMTHHPCPTHLLFQSGLCSPSIQCLFSREQAHLDWKD